MAAAKHFIVDFDSTLVTVEALDVLAEVVGGVDLEAVRRITDQAMTGELDFSTALQRRLALIGARPEHLPPTIERLRAAITPSAAAHAGFLASTAVHVISGGFRELVAPVVGGLGVPPERVLANAFVPGKDGALTGFDAANPLSRSGGKAQAVTALGLEGEVIVVGDGWTDYEIRAAGAAQRFYAFVENVERPRVVAHADRLARSFGDLLRQEAVA
jgi:D-3-phosphoglycerate dehydrogenase